jgi:hypothetical protein
MTTTMILINYFLPLESMQFASFFLLAVFGVAVTVASLNKEQ